MELDRNTPKHSAPTRKPELRLPPRRVHAVFGRLGGKYKLARRLSHIVDEWNDGFFVEVFCGAAHLTFAKKPAFIEVINDLDGEIVNVFRVLKAHHAELLRQIEWMHGSREDCDRLATTDGELLTDVQRAVRFLYVTKYSMLGRGYLRFGGGGRFRRGWNANDQIKRLAAASKRMQQMSIERLPWKACVRKYDSPQTCFYFDPPYEGFANLYGECLFAEEDHDRLAQTCRSLKGHFLLSINDSPRIRALYQGFHIAEAEVTYSSSPSAKKPRKIELLITDRPISKDVLTIINEGVRHA